MRPAADILRTAADLVEGDRNDTHGGEGTMEMVAALWSTYTGHDITPSDVGRMMALMKIARARCGKADPDHDLDAAGYLGIAGAMQ